MNEARASSRRGGGDTLDAVVVGAGFAGVCMLHQLRGLGLSTHVFEAGSGIGGTWFWNRYPGARCDIESMEYSYQFSEDLQQEWKWSERFATQPEILRYINAVADRFHLRDGIQLDTRVLSATFDESTGRWAIETGRGTVSSRFLIMATGCLSSANLPDFKGLESFAGSWYHTGNWPHEPVDFTGKRVGVVGTGSSGIQAIPIITRQGEHLFVFQRTPNYSIPAHNGPLDTEFERKIKAEYPAFREANRQTVFGANFGYNERLAMEAGEAELQREYEARWERGGLPFLAAFADLLFSREANETAGNFLRSKISAIVDDPAIAELLSPNHIVGCKRLCVDTHYFETFNRPNVTLVDVSTSPIEKITEAGLVTHGETYDLDCIVFATGFDAMTGSLLKVDIRGREGMTLRKKWSEGPRTYLGLGTSGFPNLFTITGPGSPSVLSNMLPSIEQHVNWITDCIAYMRDRKLACVEATIDAEEAWVAHVNEVAEQTLYPGCNSWYLGANVPGKPRVFMPYLGFAGYVDKCNEVAAKGYEGFAFTSATH